MAKQKNKQKQSRKRSRRRPDVIVFLAVAVLLFLFFFGDRFVTVARLNGELRDVEEQRIAANVRRLELEEELAALHSDEYLMTLARRDLGYILPGEKVMVESRVSPDLLEKQETEAVIAD